MVTMGLDSVMLTGPKGAAILSKDERYRYVLIRPTNVPGNRRMVALCLNPSKADHISDDHTAKRLCYYARREGCAVLQVLNLFAWRSTHPRDLHSGVEESVLVGPENDYWIRRYTSTGMDRATVVLGWGWEACRWPDRVERVLGMLEPHSLWCLGLTEQGLPRHPSRLGNRVQLERWLPPRS